MGEAFIVRRGGAGGLSANSAVIHVNAPTGSTITFTKGGVTVKTLGPDKSHVNSEDTDYADWYYPVGSSNYGEWTVTSTRSIDTTSKTITVETNKTYDVLLSYYFFFIRDGVLQSGYSITKGDLYKFEQRDGYVYAAANDNNCGGSIGPIPNISWPYLIISGPYAHITNGQCYLSINNNAGRGTASGNGRAATASLATINNVSYQKSLYVANVSLSGKHVGIGLWTDQTMNITNLFFAREIPT